MEHGRDLPGELAPLQVLRDNLPDCDDTGTGFGDEIHFLFEQRVPPVDPLDPVVACVLDEHRSLREIGDEVALARRTEEAMNTEMQKHGIDAGDEVPEPHTTEKHFAFETTDT